jgi:hypothetical protein
LPADIVDADIVDVGFSDDSLAMTSSRILTKSQA